MTDRQACSISLHRPRKTKSINIPFSNAQHCLKIAMPWESKVKQASCGLRGAQDNAECCLQQEVRVFGSTLSLKQRVSEFPSQNFKNYKILCSYQTWSVHCILKPQAHRPPHVSSHQASQHLVSQGSCQAFVFPENRLLKRKPDPLPCKWKVWCTWW